MTEDANNRELTRAYRDLATETTPDALDDKVLRMAAQGARSRYGIARAWVRPVAWAATIGLSLAIVLEVMQVIPPAPEPEPAPGSEAVLESLPADEAPVRLLQDAAKREDVPAAPGAVGTLSKGAPLNPGGGAAEELGARRTAQPDLPEAKESRPLELNDVDAFAADDIRILEEAEMQARQRVSAPAIATSAAASSKAVGAYCDEAARAAAETWYACIEELRKAGDTEFADSELEALRTAFPDFEVPAPGR